MDPCERILVPEWYRGATNSGSLSSIPNHQNGSASNPDDNAVRSSSRNKLSRDHDPPRSSRNSSSFRRSLSSNHNGYSSNDRESSYSRSYSSFSRNNPDRDKKNGFHDRARSYLVQNGFSHHNDSLVVGRSERDSSLRRSHSAASDRRADSSSKKPDVSSSSVVPGSIGIISKPSFEKEFPSLGTVERQPEVPRVLSPGLSTAMDNLSKITCTTIGGEGWISALAEVPVKVGGRGISASSIPQSSSETSPSSTSNSKKGLNMAETLAQAPLQNSAIPKISVDAKKSEEFTRAQYSKLIPMTPTFPKSLVSNSLEKVKPKVARSSDITGSSKVGMHHLSQPVIQTLHVPSKADNSKVSQGGNFQILTRDRNGGIPAKDGHTLNNISKGVPSVGYQAANVNPSKGISSLKPKLGSKGVTGSSIQILSGEKRVNSQAQNRNDFFNIIRKKTLNVSSELPELSTVASSQDKETPATDVHSETSHSNSLMSSNPVLSSKHSSGASEWASNHVVENYTFANNSPMLVPVEPRLAPFTEEDISSVDNENCRTETEEEILAEAVVIQGPLSLYEDEASSRNSLSPLAVEVVNDEPDATPSEEEADFMRRLGWDENADGDEITAEEIEDFLRQHPEHMTSLRLGLVGFESESLESGETNSRP